MESGTERNDLLSIDLFWIERLFLFLLVVFPTYALDLIFYLLLTLPLVQLSSIGPSGFGGIWLYLLDRFTFYLAFEYSKLLAKGFELAFLWRFTVFLAVVVHSIYIVEYLLRYHQAELPPHDETPKSTEAREIDDGLEKMKKELVEDGKKLRSDMVHMQHMIHSSLKTLRKELGEFRQEFGKFGKMMMTRVDATENMICSQLETLTENMHETHELVSKVNEDIKASNKDVKSVAGQLNETYLVIQETAKEVKAEANENKRRMIRGEDVEGFSELKEKVQRMSIEAEIAAEELSRTTVELVEAGFQQWEEDNADYLASLPLLYSNRN